MRSDRLLLLLLCLGVSLLMSRVAPAAAPAERLNLLLITVDDMNQDSVGAFGSVVPGTTPNLDRLASQGMRFVHAHVNAAICFPSRSVMMTGRYPHTSGGLGFNNISRGVPTLLETLHDAGYHTGIMAKVPHVVPDRGKAWDQIVQASELGNGRDPRKYHDHSAAFFAAAKSAGKPFFLMANSQDPHRPFAGSEQQKQKQAKVKGKGKAKKSAGDDSDDDAAAGGGAYPAPSRIYKPEEVVVPAFLPDIPDVRREIAQYYSSVHRADETVGAILKALDESGLADRTLVIFLSDHGMPLPFSKTNCYLTSTRTPLIVRWPGVVKPGVVDDQHMVPMIDLAPTVLDIFGLPALAGADGRSFQPLLRGEKQDGRDKVFTSINTISSGRSYPMRAVLTREAGYIFNAWSDGRTEFKNESMGGLTWKAMVREAADSSPIDSRVKIFAYRMPEEFYIYKDDPAALRNFAEDITRRAEVDTYRRLLHDQMKATNDPQLPAFEKLLGSRK